MLASDSCKHSSSPKDSFFYLELNSNDVADGFSTNWQTAKLSEPGDTPEDPRKDQSVSSSSSLQSLGVSREPSSQEETFE